MDRQPGLDVLGEQQHGCVGQGLSDLGRDPGAVVGVVRGHPDVEHGDVRAVVQDCRERGGCVTGIGDDVVPDLGEQGP